MARHYCKQEFYWSVTKEDIAGKFLQVKFNILPQKKSN